MISRTGTVVAAGEGCVRVSFELATACSNCADGAGCGILPIAHLLQRSSGVTIDLPLVAASGNGSAISDSIVCLPGDRVQVGIDPGRFLWLVTAGYALPLAGFLGGALLAQQFFPAGGDGTAVLGAVSGAGLIYALQRVSRSLDRSINWLQVRIQQANV